MATRRKDGETLLAMDVGNTHTVVGLFDGREPSHHWRISTDPGRTADEFRLQLASLLAEARVRWDAVGGLVLSSVVPKVTNQLLPLATGKELLVVGHQLSYSFTLALPLPEQLGADRLVNAEAALHRHGAPLIIVDCGTATTFCVIDRRRRYLGGAIAPGLGISADALFARASKLASVELKIPDRTLGNTTDTNIQSGLLIGHACFIDGMVERLRSELGEDGVTVVGTGGWMEILRGAVRRVDHFASGLTLEGLELIWDRNRSRNQRVTGRRRRR